MVGPYNVIINFLISLYCQEILMERKILLGMRYHSDENEWNVMFEKFKDETDPNEKNKIMRGLAGIQSTEVLKELVIKSIYYQ